MIPLKNAALPFALLAALCAGPAIAQDSGTGIDFSFGTKLDPSGGAARNDCDLRGTSWLSDENRRTPSGVLYVCAPEVVQTAVGEWLRSGSLSVGWLMTGGATGSPNWLRYSDWDDGFVLGFLGLEFLRPHDGTYVEVRGSHVSSRNRYVKATVGRAGKFRVEAFGRSTPNVMSTTARSIWDGVGSHELTLVDGLTPAGSSVEQVAQASAAATPMRLQVTRDKQGFGVNYFFDRRWTAYFSGTNETREGARAFGGPFFFNYPFPNNGGIYEVPRPIDDSTVNINGGMRFVGDVWRMDFAYSGSFYRSRHEGFTYENPFALWSVVPGAVSISPLVGEFASEPDNDYHNLRATLTRKLPMNGELSLSASGGAMKQNDRLLPPMNCVGYFGIDTTALGIPGDPYRFNCADWNTSAALSRQSADMRIDTGSAAANLVLQPSSRTTLRANAKYRREDYRNTYLAYNPLTGQYGYVAENGAQGGVVPGEMGIWDTGINAHVPARILSLPLDKETREASFGADFRPNRHNTFGVSYSWSEVERTNREHRKVEDHALKLTWVNRSLDLVNFRANYQYLDRSGDDYNFNPYEFTYSGSLPGNEVAHMPHTVEELRKYDVGGREQHKMTFITSIVPTDTMSLNVTLRGDWNDYDAELGRQSYDTYGVSLSWDWQPSPYTTASAYLGWDRGTLGVANVNDAGTAPNDPSLGGAVYTEDRRWWLDDSFTNRNAGATFTHDFGRVKLDASWNFTHSRNITDYRYNSANALAWPTLAEADLAGRFPQMTYRLNTFGVSLLIPLKDRWSLRLFDTYERGQITDWHYDGLENGLVIDHRVYLDSGPVGYSANLVGVMLEVQL